MKKKLTFHHTHTYPSHRIMTPSRKLDNPWGKKYRTISPLHIWTRQYRRPGHSQAGGSSSILFRQRNSRRLHLLIKLRCRCWQWCASRLRMMEFTRYTKFALPRFQIVGAFFLTLFKQKACFNIASFAVNYTRQKKSNKKCHYHTGRNGYP